MNEVYDVHKDDPEDSIYVEENIQSVEVPVIHVHANDSGENVEFIKLGEGEVLKYTNGVVALADGNQWIKIPITEVNINSEGNVTEKAFIHITEEENDEIDDTFQETKNVESVVDSSQVIVLEDGRIAYIQPLIEHNEVDETVNEELQVSLIKKNKTTKKKGKIYACMFPGCHQVYGTLYHLKVHSRNHTGDRPFKCTSEGCSKAFSTDYSRKAHLRTHTGEKPYCCPSSSCSKSFKTSGDLQKHIRVHTGERPFACPIKGCNRSFTTSNIRKVHIRTHTGEKPYVCHHEGCSRSFASSTNFKNHMRIHSGEKPYCCTVPNCMKRFTEYSSLYKHQLVHSQSKKHQCNFCKKTYRQPSSLNTHKRTTHGVISADDGTEIILEEMIGLPETGSKNFKDITSKLLKLKRGSSTIVTIENDGASHFLLGHKEDGKD